MKEFIWEFDEEEVKQEPIIGYYSNGKKMFETWNLNGKLHREDGPAIQYWYENGQRKTEIWYLNNKLHREDGRPAFQEWFYSGKIYFNKWFLNGKKYNKYTYYIVNLYMNLKKRLK